MEGQRGRQKNAIVLTPAPQSSNPRVDVCASLSSSAAAKRNWLASPTMPGVEQQIAVVKRHPRGRNMFIEDGDLNTNDKNVWLEERSGCEHKKNSIDIDG